MIQLSVLDAETVAPESDVELDDDESFFDPDSFEDDEFEVALSFL
jgi:hypothetical protein